MPRAVFAGKRDWSEEPTGQSMTWGPSAQAHNSRRVAEQDVPFVSIDGAEKWKTSGPYDYAPLVHRVWLGCAPGHGDKYSALAPGVTYRSFKLYDCTQGQQQWSAV